MTIEKVHGSGGAATGALIHDIFAKAFGYDPDEPLEDAAVLEVPSSRIALTTDSFVVTPVIFRGGDIGRLSVCGTVNDLLSRGATPKYLTAGAILEEGLSFETLKTVVRSMAETAREAGVRIVTGDTKVVEKSGSGESGLFINTAGVGVFPSSSASDERDVTAGSGLYGTACPTAAGARPGDRIIVSGTMGDHHAAILSERLSIETDIKSDCAPLGEMVRALLEGGIHVRTIRDVTRGGLATVLKELAEASAQTFVIREEAIPVDPKVSDFCGLLGLDPLYMGNEGKLVAIVPADEADKAVGLIRRSRYGEKAAEIGYVAAPADGSERNSQEDNFGGRPGDLIMRTPIGGLRSLTVLQGEGLPRIC